jgi:hypothetical protein
MNRIDKIDYLSKVVKYINLYSVCNLYNETHDEKIDYNNLRAVINKQSITRLSDYKLDSFINFLQNYFINDILKVNMPTDQCVSKDEIIEKLKEHNEEFYKKIREI